MKNQKCSLSNLAQFAFSALLSATLLLPNPGLAGSAIYYDALLNRTSGLCLDVPGSSTSNTTVQQYSCNYGNNQFWTLKASSWAGYYTIVNRNSGKCLEIPGWTKSDGALAQQYTCNGGTNQLWRIVSVAGGGDVYVNGYSGKCLDITNGTTQSGFYVQQYSCHYGKNQQFTDGAFGLVVQQ